MSKTKKIISMVLVAVLVMSSCPLGLGGLTTVASAAYDSIVWSGGSAVTGFEASVTATPVVRVAYALYSYLNGNVVVPANDAGVPQGGNTQLAGYPYNDDQPYSPTVTLKLGVTPDATPTVQVSGTQATNINLGAPSVAGTTYTWTFPTGDTTNPPTATAGDTLTYTFTYAVGGVTYTTYGASSVQPISSPPGTSAVRITKSGGGSYLSRFGVCVNFRAKGLYGRIGYTKANFGSTYAPSSKTANYVQINYNVDKNAIDRTPVANDTRLFMAFGTNNANYPSIWSTTENIAENSDWYEYGYADDANRTRADIFIDRSIDKSASDIDFEGSLLTIDSTNASEQQTEKAYISAVRTALNVTENNNALEITGNDLNSSNNPYSAQVDFNLSAEGNGVDNRATGNYSHWGFSGSVFTGDKNYIAHGAPQRLTVAYGIYGAKDADNPARLNTATDFYFYVTDKADLRGLIDVIQGKLASYTIQDFPESLSPSGTVTATKGKNPQAASFTSASYAAYDSALKAALAELANGKSKNQDTIDTCFVNLQNAYNALTPVTGTVNVRLLLNGTETPVPGSEAFTNTSYTATAGSDLTCTAPDITGYDLRSARSQTVTVTTAGTTINFYYEKQSYTYTFDPVIEDAGDPTNGLRKPTYGEVFTPESIAPNSAFNYPGYTVEGWYWDTELTNRATSVTASASGSHTFYAKWTVAPVVVHYNLGTTGVTMADSIYHPGDRLVKPADPDITGYGFLGWFKDPAFVVPFDWNATVAGIDSTSYVSEMTAYAKFESFGGYVKFNTNGADTTCANIDLSTYSAGQSVTLPQPEKLGYTFAGWYVHSDFSDATGYTTSLPLTDGLISSGVMLYAKWTANTVTLNFNLKYKASTASPIDTSVNPASITGTIGANIPATAAATSQALPGTPVKYGYTFGGWTSSTSSNRQIFETEANYNQAVNNGYRYAVEEEDAVFQATALEEVDLYPMWIRNNNSAYIDLDTYKMLYGEAIPTDDADVNIASGDIITVRMTPHTNFYTGSSLFVYMFDKNFFELVGSGSDAFKLNEESSYIATIGSGDYSGYTGSAAGMVPAGVTYPAGTSASDYSWIQIAIDPDVESGKVNPGATDDNWVVEFKLRIKATTPGSSGTVFMDEAWTRTKENNAGISFFGWCANATDSVWESFNNVIDPDLTFATSTVTIEADENVKTTVTANPDGGVWPDNSSTGTRSYNGDAGEEILGYAEPTKTGYSLGGWFNGDDEWISGYYGAPEQNGKEYTALWIGDPVTNTFIYNDGTSDSTQVDSVYGDPITTPADLEKAGYDFLGWATTSDAAAPEDLGTQDTTESAVFYGVWAPASDTPYKVYVNYVSSTGTVVTRECASQTANGGKLYIGTTGARVHLLADTTGYTDTATDVYLSYADLPTSITNYVYDPTNETNVTECTIKADGTGALILNYVGKYIEITFSANNGSFEIPDPAEVMDYGREPVYGAGKGIGYKYVDSTTYINGVEFLKTPTAPAEYPTRYGYTCLGWGANASATATAPITTANANKTYYAVWKGKTITNTFDAQGGTIGGAATATADSTFGRSITLPANPTKNGYQFKGWATTPGQTAGQTSLGDQSTETPATYYAAWELTDQTYNIKVYYMGTDGTYPAAASSSTTGSGIGEITVPYTSYEREGFTFDAAASEITKTLDATTAAAPVDFIIKFRRNTYTLTFKDGVDEANNVVINDVYYGSDITGKAPTFTRTGYTFSGWNTTPTTMPASDATYTAQWTINNHQLRFVLNDQDYVDAQTVDYGTTINAPAGEPSVTGYTFTGWSTDSAATSGATGVLGTMPDNDVTYYAIMVLQSHNAIFYAESGDEVAFATVPYNYGVQVTAPTPAPEKYGYTFNGWTPALDVMGVTDQTYTGTWTAKTITNTFNGNGGKWGDDAVVTADSTFNAAIATPADVPVRDGYTFAGWATDAAATSGSTALGNETTEDAVTYYAVWTAKNNNRYTVNIHRQNTSGEYDDSVALNTSTIYTDGVTDEMKTVTAETITGFTFDTNSVLTKQIAVDADGTVNVFDLYYTRNKYALTVDDDGAVSSSDVFFGAAVTNPTEAGKTGYSFTGWKWFNGDDEISKPSTMPAYGIKAVAQYTINAYTVTFNANSGAWGSATTQTASGDYNTAISAPETNPAKTGYTFAGWAETDSATEALASLGNFPANNDKVFYAVYTADTYTVVFNANGGAWDGTATQKVASVFDSEIVLPEEDPEKAGYTFAGWAADDEATEGSDELGTLTTAGNDQVTFYAVWTADTHSYKVNIFNMKVDGTYNETADDIKEFDGVVDTTVSYTLVPDTGFVIDPAKHTTQVVSGTVPATGTLELNVYYARAKHTITYQGQIALGTFTDAAAHKDESASTGTQRVDSYYYGETIVPATIERTGYTASWVGDTIPETMGTDDITVNIRWTANAYLVDFNANTGAWADSDTLKTVSTNFNGAIKAPATNPEKAGYTFAGWAATADATEALTSLGNLLAAGDDQVTFYAVYTINTYTATFYANNGAWGDASTEQTTEANFNAAISAPDIAPDRIGYVFAGWAATDDATEALESLGNMPVDGTSFYAVWTVDSFLLTYYVDGVLYESAEAIPFGTALIAKTAPEKYGYTFSGWSEIPATMPAEAVNIYGTFTAKTVTNIFNANGGAWGEAATKTVDSTFDADITAAEDPTKAGYTFAGWAATDDATEALESLGEQLTETPATYYAVWTADEHSYNINIYYMDLNGSYAATADTTLNDTGKVDTLASYTPDTVTGFTLDTENSVLKDTIPAEGTLTLVVKYMRNRNSIVYKVDDEEYQTVDNVYYGAEVTPIADPEKEGYTFSGWQNVEETMPDEELVITGSFTINSYDLTINYVYDADNTTAATTYTESYDFNESYEVTSPAITGYTPDKAVVSGTMGSDNVEITVKYTANTYKLTVSYEGAGSATPATNTSFVTYGEAYNVESPAVTGYTPDKAAVTGTMGASDVDVTVTYTANKYDLVITYEGAGDATPDPYSEKVTYGESYSVDSPAVTGYTPSRAKVEGTMGASDVDVTVTYTVNSYTLTFVAPKLLSTGFISEVDLADASTYEVVSVTTDVDYGTAITAPTAPQIANWKFTAWTDIPETMPANNLTVVASYERLPVSLEIKSEATTVIDKCEDGENFDGYIYGLATRLDVDTFKSSYVNVVGNGHVEVTPAFNYVQFNIVGTGTKVELYDDLTNEVIETYYVVVFGDLNGDGYCSATDVAMLKSEIAEIESNSIFDGETELCWSLDEDGIERLDPSITFAPQLLAADLNGDGNLSAADISLITAIAGWAKTVDQQTGEITTY